MVFKISKVLLRPLYFIIFFCSKMSLVHLVPSLSTDQHIEFSLQVFLTSEFFSPFKESFQKRNAPLSYWNLGSEAPEEELALLCPPLKLYRNTLLCGLDTAPLFNGNMCCSADVFFVVVFNDVEAVNCPLRRGLRGSGAVEQRSIVAGDRCRLSAVLVSLVCLSRVPVPKTRSTSGKPSFLWYALSRDGEGSEFCGHQVSEARDRAKSCVFPPKYPLALFGHVQTTRRVLGEFCLRRSEKIAHR